MASYYTIELDQLPNYTFRTTLPDAGEFTIGLRYQDRFDRWLFDLFDANGDAIITGKKVVLDQPMLVQIVDSRRPPGDFIFLEEGTTRVEPGFSDLGTRVKLWYITGVAAGDTP